MEDILTFKMVNATFHLERNKLGRTGVLFVWFLQYVQKCL
jgi:hypothetical protein